MEKIAKYTTIIYAIMWFIGFVSTYIYYSVFDINIVSYLDFSEILFMFFVNLLNPQTLFKIILTLLATLSILYILFRSSKSTPKFISIMLVLAILASIMILIIYFILVIIGSDKVDNISFSILGITLLYVFKLYSDYGNHHYKKRKNPIINFVRQIRYISNYTLRKVKLAHFIIIVSVLYTTFFIGYTSYTNAVRLKETNTRYSSEISFNYFERAIKSNSTNIFVGSVRNYIFMYDRENHNTKIYEKNNLTNYEIIVR